MLRLEDREWKEFKIGSTFNTDKGIYYYKTYDNSRISAVNLFNVELNSADLFSYPLQTKQDIFYVPQA